MPFLVIPDPSNSDEASFFGFPSVKRRRKSITRMLKTLKRLRHDEDFYLRLTCGFPTNGGGFFDGDGDFKLSVDCIDCAISDLQTVLERF